MAKEVEQKAPQPFSQKFALPPFCQPLNQGGVLCISSNTPREGQIDKNESFEFLQICLEKVELTKMILISSKLYISILNI